MTLQTHEAPGSEKAEGLEPHTPITLANFTGFREPSQAESLRAALVAARAEPAIEAVAPPVQSKPGLTNGPDILPAILARASEVWDALGLDLGTGHCEGDNLRFKSCPWRPGSDSNAFTVSHDGASWYDHTTGEGGGLLDAVKRGCNLHSNRDALALCRDVLNLGEPDWNATPTLAELDEAAAHYGLAHRDFLEAGCSLEFAYFPGLKRKAWAIAYPTIGANGKPGPTKHKSVTRHKGKRLSTGRGNPLIIPGGNLSGPGPLVYTGGEEKAIALRKAGFRAVSGSHGEKLDEANAAFIARNASPDGITIAFDADQAGVKGALDAARKLTKARPGLVVRIVEWPADARKGRDLCDDFREGGPEAVRARIASAKPFDPEAHKDEKAVPRVDIEANPTNQSPTLDAVRAVLAKLPNLFQRGGRLCRIVHVEEADGQAGPRIVDFDRAALEVEIDRAVQILGFDARADGLLPKRVPRWVPDGLLSQFEHPGVRPIRAIVEAPTLRRDGTIAQRRGYDSQTGLFFDFEPDAFPQVPENPTREDAAVALAMLREVVIDFPFAQRAHESAWLALPLTLLARHAVNGPVPAYLLDANTRGSGKSMLCDAASIIATGRPASRSAIPRDEDEGRKRITSSLLAGGGGLLLFDNIEAGTAVAGACLDAVLTSEWWEDRQLGTNSIIRLPNTLTLAFTGNNLAIGGDMARRGLVVCLESREERPELRDGFKHSNLLAWVRSERPRLVCAALTILRAYVAAGRPSQGLSRFGSFENWSGLVREALVFAGAEDPCRTVEELAGRDATTKALGRLLDAWPALDPTGNGITSKGIVQRLGEEHAPEGVEAAREALDELIQRRPGVALTARSLSRNLGKYLKRPIRGQRLISFEDRKGFLWFAVERTGPQPGPGTGKNRTADNADSADMDFRSSRGNSTRAGSADNADTISGRDADERDSESLSLDFGAGQSADFADSADTESPPSARKIAGGETVCISHGGRAETESAVSAESAPTSEAPDERATARQSPPARATAATDPRAGLSPLASWILGEAEGGRFSLANTTPNPTERASTRQRLDALNGSRPEGIAAQIEDKVLFGAWAGARRVLHSLKGGAA